MRLCDTDTLGEGECSVGVRVEEESPQPPIGRVVSIGPARVNNTMRCCPFLSPHIDFFSKKMNEKESGYCTVFRNCWL